MQFQPIILQAMYVQRWGRQPVGEAGIVLTAVRCELRRAAVGQAPRLVAEAGRGCSARHDDSKAPVHPGITGRQGVFLQAELVLQEDAKGKLGALAESCQPHPLSVAFILVHCTDETLLNLLDGGRVADGRLVR